MKTTLEISKNDLLQLEEDFEVTRLPDSYIVRIIEKANEIGLKGKKIKEIVKVKENFATGNIYIDFITE